MRLALSVERAGRSPRAAPRAPRGRRPGHRARGAAARRDRHLRQQVRVLLHPPAAARDAPQSLRQGRRLPPVVPARQLHHAERPRRGRARRGSSSSDCRRSTSPCTPPIPTLRWELLGKPRHSAEILPRLERLAKAGIRMHAQIVLCPGLNDGAHLERTVRELAPLHPHDRHHRDRARRAHAPPRAAAAAAHAPDDEARRWWPPSGGWQASFLPHARQSLRVPRRRGVSAGRTTRCRRPTAYEGFAVAEDGIGLVRRFEDDLAARRRRRRERSGRGRRG